MSRHKKKAPLLGKSILADPLSSSQAAAFSRINNDLNSALKDWGSLSIRAPSLAADEKRLKEMQKLLQELQRKMKDLGL